jgi:hypothetical protein
VRELGGSPDQSYLKERSVPFGAGLLVGKGVTGCKTKCTLESASRFKSPELVLQEEVILHEAVQWKAFRLG